MTDRYLQQLFNLTQRFDQQLPKAVYLPIRSARTPLIYRSHLQSGYKLNLFAMRAFWMVSLYCALSRRFLQLTTRRIAFCCL
ncbi:hypothetical protein GCM10027341_53980 [Spirosoma knui]